MLETTLENKAYLGSSNFGPVTKPEIVTAGADLVKGTVLGRVTADGKMKAYAAGNSDGSENPVAILWADAAAASADVEAITAFAGVYKEGTMVGLDAAAKTAMEARAIYFV